MQTVKILEVGAGETLVFAKKIRSLSPSKTLYVSTDIRFSYLNNKHSSKFEKMRRFFLSVKTEEKARNIFDSNHTGCFRADGTFENFSAPNDSLDMIFINCWHALMAPRWNLFRDELLRCLKNDGVIFWSHPVHSFPNLDGFKEVHNGTFHEIQGNFFSKIFGHLDLRERIENYPKNLPYKIPMTKTMSRALIENIVGHESIDYIYHRMNRSLRYGVLVKE